MTNPNSNADLAAVKDAMDEETGGGRDNARAVALADAYVNAHPEQFADLKALTLPELVTRVDRLCAVGKGGSDEHWRVEAYLLAKFEPQKIGGEYTAQTRRPEL